MQIVQKDELSTSRNVGEGSVGIYEVFVQRNIEDMLSMESGQAAIITIDEIGSKADKPTGCIYGLNKVFVAAELPYKATAYKKLIKVERTGDFYDYKLYACKDNVPADKTDYEQPSPGQIDRVQNWLAEHPELFEEDKEDEPPEEPEEDEDPEQSEKPEEDQESTV